MHCSEQWLFLFCYSFERVFLEDSSDCLGGDWIGDDGIDVFGGLNSIGGLASSDLCDNRTCIGRGQFRKTTTKRELLVWNGISKDSGHSRLADNDSRCNKSSRVTMRDKEQDIFLGRGREKMYRKNRE